MDQKGLDCKVQTHNRSKIKLPFRISSNTGHVRQIWSIKTTHSYEKYWDIKRLAHQHG